ncbi:Yip1 family protein [Roseobacter sp. HKCC-CH-9208]|uniref:Yip1 family protein n=1 Tax=Roseobacter sp. HKCC-CH-9208 TaxID=3120339 RepID=UPI0030EE43D4
MNLSEILTLSGLWRHTRDTIRAPQEAAQAVLALNLPRNVLWLGLALVITLSTLLASAVLLMVPMPEAGAGVPMPVVMGIVQAVFLVLVSLGIAVIGARFGGKGDFDGALALMAWLQAVFLVVQAFQIAAIAIGLSVLADIVSLASIPLFFWLMAQFVTVLHGFSSVWKTFWAIIMFFIAFVFLLSLVVTSFGLVPMMP